MSSLEHHPQTGHSNGHSHEGHHPKSGSPANNVDANSKQAFQNQYKYVWNASSTPAQKDVQISTHPESTYSNTVGNTVAWETVQAAAVQALLPAFQVPNIDPTVDATQVAAAIFSTTGPVQTAWQAPAPAATPYFGALATPLSLPSGMSYNVSWAIYEARETTTTELWWALCVSAYWTV